MGKVAARPHHRGKTTSANRLRARKTIQKTLFSMSALTVSCQHSIPRFRADRYCHFSRESFLCENHAPITDSECDFGTKSGRIAERIAAGTALAKGQPGGQRSNHRNPDSGSDLGEWVGNRFGEVRNAMLIRAGRLANISAIGGDGENCREVVLMLSGCPAGYLNNVFSGHE